MLCMLGCALMSCGVMISALAFPTDSANGDPSSDYSQSQASQQGTSACYVLGAWYPLSFALLYGALFAKLKRVSSIISNKKLVLQNPKALHRQSFFVLLLFMVPQVVILDTWFVVSPM
jgi:hypothetical protein